MSYVNITAGFSDGTIRLYRNGVTSSSYYYGIVQIWYNRQWGNICDDSDYNLYEADVICHQLGYIGASSYSRAGIRRLVIEFEPFPLFNHCHCSSCGTDYSSMTLNHVNCTNKNYLTILQYSYSTSIDNGCTSNSYDATVYCCKFDSIEHLAC